MSAGRAVGLLLGVVADATFGDPHRGHPVAAFGAIASRIEHVMYQDRRAAGVAYTGVLVGGSALVGAATERVTRDRPVLQVAATAVITWAVLGGASLAREGTAMGRSLASGDLDAARRRLGNLCGREAEHLDRHGLARATVESMAENTSDAVVAPLVWGAVAGLPGLLGYRAVNTLDAMVGHRSPRYRDFGWAAARLDDLANLAPSRLAALLTASCAPLVGGSARGGLRAWRRDAAAHPSPNAGQVEAAFAGALGIRLGGCTVYRHGVEERPVLGDGRTADACDVPRSVQLSRAIGTAAGALAAVTAGVLGLRHRKR